MTYNKAKTFASLCSIAILFVVFGNIDAYGEDRKYKMAGDITPTLTFMFRDGTETHEFPVFGMGENFVSNSGVTFSVEGTVTDSPLLHKAMDEAYKYRLVSGNGFEYPYKYFDVDVDFVRDNESVFMLDYNNCRINNYRIETLDSNDYESYFKEVGFAIVDKINFECSGVDYDNDVKRNSTMTHFVDYGESKFKFANNMKTSVTFSFDGGIEKMEFPFFKLTTGYEESSGTVAAEFEVEGILEYYPLLYEAINNARHVSGIGSTSNTDFEALVEFTNGQTSPRGFDFRDCRVTGTEITTRTDKEEGFTGKSGFAVVHRLEFACSGLKPINMHYDELGGDTPIWKRFHLTSMYEEQIQNSDKGLKLVAAFTYPNGSETIEFSMFTQDNMLTTSEGSFNKKTVYPTFELRGIVGNYPMLYKFVDDNRKIHHVSGTQNRDLADVDINLIQEGTVIRGFSYSDCRPINHIVSTEPNSEESYIKNTFALENIFDFECQGYAPNNPMYDTMFNTYDKAQTLNTNDLRETHSWGPGFFIK